MMVGELDYGGMLVDKISENVTAPGSDALSVPLPQLTIGLFFTFVLTVSVVLVNLLVGLAVGDIEAIQRTARLRALIDQTLLVHSLVKYYPRCILQRARKSIWEIKPNRNTMIKRFIFGGNDPTDGEFMDKLRYNRNGEGVSEDDFYTREHLRQEKQEQAILKLQATLETQCKILKAMADRLKITEYD